MKAALIAAAMVLSAGAAHAAGEPWRAITQQCDDEAERTFCVGKAGCPNWEWLAACTAQNYYRSLVAAPSEANYLACVARAKRSPAAACASCGDVVAEVFKCLGQ